MENIKIFESVINSNVINEIEDANWCTDLAQYATCKCKIDGLIAAAYLFCPQLKQVKEFKKLENKKLPQNFDYSLIKSLRIEAKQKLNLYQPINVGQASRISGVSPADISVLLVYLEQRNHNRK